MVFFFDWLQQLMYILEVEQNFILVICSAWLSFSETDKYMVSYGLHHWWYEYHNSLVGYFNV